MNFNNNSNVNPRNNTNRANGLSVRCVSELRKLFWFKDKRCRYENLDVNQGGVRHLFTVHRTGFLQIGSMVRLLNDALP